MWVSFGTACTGIFIPVYLDGAIPAVLAAGGEHFQEGSAWWTFERLREAAAVDFARAAPVLREGWSALEEKIEHERQGVESEAREFALADDGDRAAAMLTDFMGRMVEELLERVEQLRARITG